MGPCQNRRATAPPIPWVGEAHTLQRGAAGMCRQTRRTSWRLGSSPVSIARHLVVTGSSSGMGRMLLRHAIPPAGLAGEEGQAMDLRNHRSAPISSMSSGRLAGTSRCLRVACLLSPRPGHPFSPLAGVVGRFTHELAPRSGTAGRRWPRLGGVMMNLQTAMSRVCVPRCIRTAPPWRTQRRWRDCFAWMHHAWMKLA
jgi:hypothetical protein